MFIQTNMSKFRHNHYGTPKIPTGHRLIAFLVTFSAKDRPRFNKELPRLSIITIRNSLKSLFYNHTLLSSTLGRNIYLWLWLKCLPAFFISLKSLKKPIALFCSMSTSSDADSTNILDTKSDGGFSDAMM